jgi:hypothetical protein
MMANLEMLAVKGSCGFQCNFTEFSWPPLRSTVA